MHVSTRVLALAAALLTAGASLAQAPAGYPNRPVRLVIPFAPGGTADTIGRIIADNLMTRLGRPIVLDTRSGANGVVGCQIVAQSNPDGHTMIVVAAGYAVNPSLRKNLPFDSLRDLTPVGLVGNGPYLLVTHPSIPAKTVSEFVAYAKTRPGQIAYATTGVGSPGHLAGELLRTMAGIDILHVPYKGGGAVMPDLLAGRVQSHYSSVSTAGTHVRAGRLVAIAMTTPKRSPAMPEVPTFHESGLKGYDVSGWYGLLAPGKTPPAIINYINGELQKVLADGGTLKRLDQIGIEPVPSPPAHFAALIKSEIPKWAKVLRTAGIEPE